MSGSIDRRGFLKKSAIASIPTLALSLQKKASLAGSTEKPVAPEGSTKTLPTGSIGNVKISRLIAGGNPFSGWSHSRDLKYLSELFKAYSTDEKILQTLELYEENGIDPNDPDMVEYFWGFADDALLQMGEFFDVIEWPSGGGYGGGYEEYPYPPYVTSSMPGQKPRRGDYDSYLSLTSWSI